MKVLNQIDTKFVTGIDIETVRVAENFEDLSEGFQSAWEYKNKQDGEIPSFEELSELWEKKASLYAEFSKICAVSLCFLNNENLVCKEFYGEDEKGLLLSLGITLHNMQAASNNYRLVGHAAKYFDYPFLAKRYIINELSVPNCMDTSLLKPWEHTNLCTNELWRGFGTGAGSSLQALCNVLNIPVSKVDLVGDEVGKAYFKGELERIGRYCSYDTIATWNVVRRFKKEPAVAFDDVEYITAFPDGTEEKKQLSLLQKIYQDNGLSEQTKEEIKKLAGKKKLTKKDKDNLFTIIRGIYVRTDFEHRDQDSKKVIEQKEKEIKELIKSLKLTK